MNPDNVKLARAILAMGAIGNSLTFAVAEERLETMQCLSPIAVTGAVVEEENGESQALTLIVILAGVLSVMFWELLKFMFHKWMSWRVSCIEECAEPVVEEVEEVEDDQEQLGVPADREMEEVDSYDQLSTPSFDSEEGERSRGGFVGALLEQARIDQREFELEEQRNILRTRQALRRSMRSCDLEVLTVERSRYSKVVHFTSCEPSRRIQERNRERLEICKTCVNIIKDTHVCDLCESQNLQMLRMRFG